MNQYVQTPLLERFEAKYVPEPNSGCWLWIGAVAGAGYGVLYAGGSRYAKGRQQYAHAVSYMLHKGPIPKGLIVRHTCDNTYCVNPDHLLLGTQADNLADAFARKRVQRGGAHPNAKISDEAAAAIRQDPRPAEVIALEYGIAVSTANRFKRGPRRVRKKGPTIKYGITNQRTLRRAFWENNSHLPRKPRRRDRNGELTYPVDTRCAFVDYIDSLSKDGTISQDLAQRATLD